MINKITDSIFFPTTLFNLVKMVGICLGHTWSFCTYPIRGLIKRITKASFLILKSKAPKPESAPKPQPLKPKKFYRPKKTTSKTTEKQQEKTDTPKKPIAGLDGLNLDSLFPDEGTKLTEADSQSSERTKKIEALKAKNLKGSDVLSTKEPEISTAVKSPISAPSTVEEPKPKKFKVIEAGGGGDCLILSFLKGLKTQYPKLAEYPKDGAAVSYTASEIRKMGVDFAREQIDKGTDQAITVLGYLDNDQKEFNEDIFVRIDSILKRAIDNRKNQLAKKEITQEEYDAAIKIAEDRTNQLKKKYKDEKECHFLDRLEETGFYCGSLHLYALSMKFKIPIHVKLQNGILNHDLCIFNPSKSTEKPIHLLRKQNQNAQLNHYQLIVYED